MQCKMQFFTKNIITFKWMDLLRFAFSKPEPNNQSQKSLLLPAARLYNFILASSIHSLTHTEFSNHISFIYAIYIKILILCFLQAQVIYRFNCPRIYNRCFSLTLTCQNKEPYLYVTGKQEYILNKKKLWQITNNQMISHGK